MLNPPAIVLTGFIAVVAAAQLFGTDSPEKTAGLVATEPAIWSAQEGGNGHWYMTIRDLDSDLVNWEDACRQCEDMGGHLVTITSRGEQRFLAHTLGARQPNQIGKGTFGWIGITTNEQGVSGWVTGEPWSFTSRQISTRRSSSASDHFIMSGRQGHTGRWDRRSEVARSWSSVTCWTIEWSDDCNGDGLVDYGQILNGTLADEDGNGVPDCCDQNLQPPPIQMDLNNDQCIDERDLKLTLRRFGHKGWGRSDINNDGITDVDDVLLVLSKWNEKI